MVEIRNDLRRLDHGCRYENASRNDGRLPMSLADIELHCPHDPMTGKPFLV